MTTDFPDRLLSWWERFGRKDLPWHRDRDPYKIWVSEIMLQQTQVSTVIPYFERFIARFPDIQSLSESHIDDVLHLWTGLGYYARARNLQRAAQVIVREHQGRIPHEAAALYALPGIGKSTAHAILAFAFSQPVAILDGNVKRVLTRHFRVHGWPGRKAVENELWNTAQANTPHHRTADYTQAIMDLGATVCMRRKPVCTACPVSKTCLALAHGEQHRLPTSAPDVINRRAR